MRVPHTGIYAIRERSNVFSVFILSEMEQNDIFGSEYVVKVHLSVQQLAKEHLHLARKVTSFVK